MRAHYCLMIEVDLGCNVDQRSLLRLDVLGASIQQARSDDHTDDVLLGNRKSWGAILRLSDQEAARHVNTALSRFIAKLFRYAN
jgi:hypothetical protein